MLQIESWKVSLLWASVLACLFQVEKKGAAEALRFRNAVENGIVSVQNSSARVATPVRGAAFQDSCNSDKIILQFWAVNRFRQIILCALGTIIASALGAQVTQTDFSKRNRKIESQRYDTKGEIPQPTNRWMSKRFDTTQFSTQQYRFSDDKFKVQKMDLYKSDRFRTKELDMEMVEPVDFRGGDQLFSSKELDQIKYNTLHHDVKKNSRLVDENSVREIDDMAERLSLADLNRYQFRRSHSREPGIPVQQAASAEAAE
ncbi:hypothetical protein [Puniceicoccus vermicola]|uniref:Uncharacterized protein n=1 Tax=Puniceicoccus vermicola TaxID=388746 RepID=A0A7X1B2Z9_9BACT|nr:hypothetical protein [Puniceicoccus vermicola]MBC2603465.1 hypothetical protein [Puniceicoccus vermicola]